MSSAIRLSVAALTSEGLMTTQFPRQRPQQAPVSTDNDFSKKSYILFTSLWSKLVLLRW